MKSYFRVAFASMLLAAIVWAAPANAAQANAQSAPPKVQDGSHDFDFVYDTWRMPNHRLAKRLAGSHEWDDFVTCDEGEPLPGGIGDMDIMRANYWPNFVGVTVRTYDAQSGLWRLYWFDNQFSHGVMDPPLEGKFNGSELSVGVRKSKTVALRHPVVPVSNGFRGRVVGINSRQL